MGMEGGVGVAWDWGQGVTGLGGWECGGHGVGTGRTRNITVWCSKDYLGMRMHSEVLRDAKCVEVCIHVCCN